MFDAFSPPSSIFRADVLAAVTFCFPNFKILLNSLIRGPTRGDRSIAQG